MKNILAIALFLVARQLCAQVSTDSLAVRNDSAALRDDSLGFKPQYRHGVKYLIKTSMGTKYVGFVVKETRDVLVLLDKTTYETIELKKSAIVQSKAFSSQENFFADITGDNRFAHHYMFSGSAFLLRKDGLNSNNHWLLLENLDYGFSENWGVTMSSITLYPVSIGIKCAFQLDEMNYIGGNIFSAGNLLVTSDVPLWGYGALAKFTHGDSNRNFTLSGGVIGLNSHFFYNPPPASYIHLPFASLAYCSRLRQKTALNLEGWYLPELKTAFAAVGIKLVDKEESCWTFGCYGIFNNFNTVKVNVRLKTIPLPYVSLLLKL